MKRGVKKQTGQAGAIRIISGKWRGRKLPVLDAQGLRPTTDRTKETLFNWLMPYINDRVCLDAFAGSGGLGFEALSRHAKRVDFIEKDRAAYQQLLKNIETLKIDKQQASVAFGDMQQRLKQTADRYDLVFLDPPFGYALIPAAIALLEQQNALNNGALIYIECEANNADYPVPQNWQLLKDKSTSQVSSRLFQYSSESTD